MIFDLYVNKKMTQTEIADRLNLLGFKTLYNKPFTVRATSLILSNEAYIGTLRYELKNLEPIVVENAHPAIIEKELFEKAQILLAERRTVPQDSRRGTYLLSKLIKCPKCGTTLSFTHSFKSSTRRDRGKELYILNCYASLSHKKKALIKTNPELRCDNYGSPANYVEVAVLKSLEAYVDELTVRIEESKSSNQNKMNGLDSQIELINNRLSKLTQERKRIQDGYKDGIYESEEAQQLLKGNKETRLKLEHEKKELESKDSSTDIMKLVTIKEDVIRFLSTDDQKIKDANKFLRSIINHVVYSKKGRGNHLQRKHPEILVDYKF